MNRFQNSDRRENLRILSLNAEASEKPSITELYPTLEFQDFTKQSRTRRKDTLEKLPIAKNVNRSMGEQTVNTSLVHPFSAADAINAIDGKYCYVKVPIRALKQTQGSRSNYKMAFVIYLLMTVYFAIQIGLYMFTGINRTKEDILTAIFLSLVLFNLVNSIYLSHGSLKSYLCMIFLMDTLAVTQIAADIGMIGFIYVMGEGEPITYINAIWMVAYPIYNLFHSLNARLYLIRVRLQKWQFIIFKISTLSTCILFFCYSAYMMLIDFALTNGADPQKDEKVVDFALLFSFGNFAHFFEILSKISDFDQTSELKHRYCLKQQSVSAPFEEILQNESYSLLSANQFVKENSQQQNF